MTGDVTERRDDALAALDADDPERRRAAAEVLLDIAQSDTDVFEDATVRCTLLDRRDDPAVRPLLHGVLKRHFDDRFELAQVPDQTEALRSGDADRQRAAAAFLRRRADPYNERQSEVDAMFDLVGDDTAGMAVRCQAARTLSYRAAHFPYRSRLAEVVPGLLEIATAGDVDGRGAAARLLTEAVVRDDASFDDATLDAVADALCTALSDADYRVRLRALAPLSVDQPYDSALGDRLADIVDAVEPLTDDERLRVAERAEQALANLPTSEGD